MTTTTVVLVLAWFAATNALASVIAWVAARPRGGRWPHTAGALLLVRLFPATLSIVFTAGLFLPSHLVLEPREARETLGLFWYLLAAAGTLLLVRSGARAWQIWCRGRRFIRLERHAPGADASVIEINGLVGVSLAGVFRPRILVGADVIRQLSPAELDVAIAHELAHRAAFDNFARWLMLCAPDFSGATVRMRRLEAAWHEAAESLADSRAVDGDRTRALHLASALVKVARLTTFNGGHPPAPAWSTLIDPPLLERRVRKLLAGRLDPLAPRVELRTAAIAAALAIVAACPLAAGSLHRLTEELVRLLP